MSIASEITRIQNAKTALKSSIEAKGVSVPAEAKIDTYPGFVDTISGGGGQEISGQVEVTLPFGEDLNAGDAVCIIDLYAHDTSVKVKDFLGTIGTSMDKVALSPDDMYLVVGKSDTGLRFFKRKVNEYIELTSQAYTFTDTINTMCFNSSGEYLLLASISSPRILIFRRVGDIFTKLADPAVLPSGYGMGAVFIPNTNYVIVSNQSSPYTTIYEVSGDTITRIGQISPAPSTSGWGVAISPCGTYVVILHFGAPWMKIYKRSGLTFTVLSNPGGLPSSGEPKSITFSPCGNYLVLCTTLEPRVFIYKRIGDTFTRLADPDILPSSTANCAAFSSDSTYMAVCTHRLPCILIYKRDGDVFTKMPDVSETPAFGSGHDAIFGIKDSFLFCAFSQSPYTAIYRGGTYLGSYAFKSNNKFEELINTVGAGYAAEDGALGEEKKVIKIWG